MRGEHKLLRHGFYYHERYRVAWSSRCGRCATVPCLAFCVADELEPELQKSDISTHAGDTSWCLDVGAMAGARSAMALGWRGEGSAIREVQTSSHSSTPPQIQVLRLYASCASAAVQLVCRVQRAAEPGMTVSQVTSSSSNSSSKANAARSISQGLVRGVPGRCSLLCMLFELFEPPLCILR